MTNKQTGDWGIQTGLYQGNPVLLGVDGTPTMQVKQAWAFLTYDAAAQHTNLVKGKPINLIALGAEEKEGDVSRPAAAGLATGSTDQPAPAPIIPVPMLLWCPECGERHIDSGDFATKVHHTHACQACGMVWRPAVVPTVGVRWLPGYKDRGEV